ncbi:MAG: hypothetical protein KKA73_28965 [Chloroflexi bacterium]|nr:hypothetical protein [Chloroflexota bacterium]MBU1751726.1 hypothetical protein [Chloroflexota bacterium]MBU1877954.1 hypothetical protein [Chloroflexota bacterium]
MITAFLDQVTSRLAQAPGVNDWLVRQVQMTEHQLYLIGDAPESARTVQNTELHITVYNDHAGEAGPVRGSSQITLLPADLPRLDDRLRDAVFMASITNNPPFTLPGPAFYPAVETADPRLLANPAATLRTVGDAIRGAVQAERDVRLSSAEVFLRERHITLRNSQGAAGEHHGTNLALDWVLMAGHAPDEAERHNSFKRRRRSDVDIAAQVGRDAQQARDGLRAVLPQARRGPVVISGPALHELFLPWLVHTGAQFHYQRFSNLQVGESVFASPPQGDSFTFVSDGLLPYGSRTASFDEDGVPRQVTVLIQNGVLKHLWAEHRYAEYLGVPATGAFANARLIPGSTPLADLLAGDDVTHVVAFSWLNPDPITGKFSGEIRLAYQRRNGTWQPVKGGAVSGDVFEAFANARFSADTQFLGDYLGPEAIRFEDLVVAGE